MKRLLSTVLLACFVLGAWAQNKTKMTEEEKKKTMEGLEALYQLETADAYTPTGSCRAEHYGQGNGYGGN